MRAISYRLPKWRYAAKSHSARSKGYEERSRESQIRVMRFESIDKNVWKSGNLEKVVKRIG